MSKGLIEEQVPTFQEYLTQQRDPEFRQSVYESLFQRQKTLGENAPVLAREILLRRLRELAHTSVSIQKYRQTHGETDSIRRQTAVESELEQECPGLLGRICEAYEANTLDGLSLSDDESRFCFFANARVMCDDILLHFDVLKDIPEIGPGALTQSSILSPITKQGAELVYIPTSESEFQNALSYSKQTIPVNEHGRGELGLILRDVEGKHTQIIGGLGGYGLSNPDLTGIKQLIVSDGHCGSFELFPFMEFAVQERIPARLIWGKYEQETLSRNDP